MNINLKIKFYLIFLIFLIYIPFYTNKRLFFYVLKFKKKIKNDEDIIKSFPPFPEKYLILPKYIGFQTIRNINIRNNRSIELVIAILSSPYNFKKRYSFRYTYYKYCGIKNSKIIFFLGNSKKQDNNLIAKESNLFNDLVQFSFQNSYLNLTLLSIMALKYSFNYFNNIRFYIKTDDDILVNYKLLLLLISNNNLNSNTIYGHFGYKFLANRNNKSTAYIPFSEYSFKYVPNYVFGGLIIIPKEAMKKIYNQTLYKQNYIWKEDVNLGILSNKAGIKVKQFPFNIDIKLDEKICKTDMKIIAAEIASVEDKFYCMNNQY